MGDVLEYFGEMMQHQFMVSVFIGEDEYGNPQFDQPTGPWRGRVDLVTHQRGASGSASTVDKPDKDEPDGTIISEPVPVHVRDRIAIVDPDHPALDGLSFVATSVAFELDEDDVHHLEITIRWERP